MYMYIYFWTDCQAAAAGCQLPVAGCRLP